MDKTKAFQTELMYIQDEKMLKNAKILIELLPDYFFQIPASSTGKYHPRYALGDGGLVRHTKTAVTIANTILTTETIGSVFNQNEKDMIIISLLIHDGFKSGLIKSQYTVAEHPSIMAKFILDNADKLTLEPDQIKLISQMVETHSGEFNKDYKGNPILPKPSNKYQKFVHMCDYLSSQKYLQVEFENNEIVR